MVRFLLPLIAALGLVPPGVRAEPVFAPDPTGAVSAAGIHDPMPLEDLVPRIAGALRKEADPRLGVWIALQKAGDLDGLIAATEADLRGPDPHPSATHVWAWTQWARGTLAPDRLPEPPADLAGRLDLAARAFRALRLDREDLLARMAEETLARGQVDYWADYDIGYAACATDLRTACLKIGQRLVEAFPADFGAAFLVGGNFSGDGATLMAWLDAHPAVAAAPGGALIRWMMENPELSAVQIRAVARAWLAVVPDDPNALRRAGGREAVLHRPDAALDLFRQEEEVFPFRDAPLRVARTLAELRRFDAARQEAADWAARAVPAADRPAFAALILVRAFAEAGEHGFAREAGLAGLDAAPGFAPLRRALAASLLTEGFPAEAVDLLAPVLAADPADYAAAGTLVEALRADDRPRDALAAFEAYRAAGGLPNDTAYNAARAALSTLGDTAGLDRLHDLARQDLPGEAWLLGNFGYELDRQGRHSEAFDAIRAAVITAPASDWRLARLVDYADRAGRIDEAVALLREVTARHPYLAEAWAQLGRATGDDLTIWDRARSAAPRAAFPDIRAAKALAKATPAAWEAIQDRMAEAALRLEAAGADPGALAALLAEKAGQIDDATYAGRLHDPGRIATGLAELDRARDLGMAEDEYWQLRYYLLSRLGASPELTEAALRNAATHPDDQGVLTHLFTGDVQANLGNGALAFVEYHRYVERRPRSSERLLGFAHRHNKWGGSPVVALAALDRAKRWDPEARVQVETDHAYGTLGAYKRYYEAQYDRSFSISESNLYIDWFERARADARAPQPTIRALDLDTMTVTMIQTDGTEWMRQFHPVTGRLVSFRVGRAEGGFDYDGRGNVTRMWMGGRIDIRLGYADDGAGGTTSQIVRMDQRDGPTLGFGYDAEGRAVRIEVEGLGRLLVDYDAGGDIAEVRSEAADGSGDGGSSVALAVSEAFAGFQTVLRMVDDVQAGRFDDIALADPELEALQDRLTEANYDEAVSLIEYTALEMEMGQLLMRRLGDLPGHASRAAMHFDGVFDRARFAIEDIAAGVDGTDPADLATWQELGIRAAGQWRRLAAETRPDGLPEDMWDRWGEMRGWVASLEPASPAVVGARAEFEAELAGGGLRLLSEAGWLRASPLANPGFWRSYGRTDVFPRVLVDRGLRMTDILQRDGGDVVVAADRGLAVFRRGFWEWFGFDRQAGAFSASLDPAAIEAHSNVTALAEDGRGRLWVGTRAGLILIDGDYGGPARVWRADDAAALGGPVEALAANGDRLAVGTGAGLTIWDLGSLAPVDRLARPVAGLRPARDGFLALGRDGLWWQGPRGARDLTDFQVTDALLSPADGGLYLLAGERVLRADWPAAADAADSGIPAAPGPFQPVDGQETIAGLDAPAGLAWLDVLPGRSALTVLTDQGGSVLGRGGFELFSEPGRDRPTGFLRASAGRGNLWLLTSDGVAAMVRGQTRHAYDHRVHDLLTMPELGSTFIATGWSIDRVDHRDAAAGPQPFAEVDARILRRAPDGALITHDGRQVLRFAPGDSLPEELFLADQTVPADQGQAPIEDLLAASDGSIWALAGASAFRWQAEGGVTEFTVYAGPPDYAVWSDSLHAIHETPDGRILLVASNNGHRSYRNRNLEGGLFEFDGRRFVRADLDLGGSWFATSLTPMPDGSAVVGTNRGFARLAGDRMTEFRLAGDESYLALRDDHPALYLGSRGARLGEDLWLFGTAAGIVARKGETWFYPDRLNWALPAPDYASYGARVVHAVETDPAGRIYAATDWGLTIHDPDGAGPEAFLVSEARADFAFAALEQGRMRAVNDVLIDALPPESDAGRLAEAFRKSARQIAALEEKLDRAVATGSAEQQDLERQVLRARQRDLALLARLEQENPTLFTMLQLNPMDLRAFAGRLPDGVAVAQYLPADRRLYINLVSRDGEVLREVHVDRAELDARARRVAAALAGQARGQLRGFGTDAAGTAPAAGLAALAEVAAAAADSGSDTEADLAWLYDQLLRPIENDVPAGTALVVSPAGALSYVPFAALVRETGPSGPRHAIDRFDLAVAPSLYALDTMIRALPSAGYSQLVLGDPDGSLPAARQEAQAIAGLLDAETLVELRIGEDASYEALQDFAADAQFVHLATHGKLDPLSPKDSYLLLAGNRRMSIPQIMTIPMTETELVFLSACESGLGADGLEYRTLAHAFVHAGARAVIATLWQVDDAATADLAEAFYRARLDGKGNAGALAAAQRAMIAAGGDHARPGYWAGVMLFGAP